MSVRESQPTSPVVTDDLDGGVRVLTLNRPERLNALTPEVVSLLVDELDRADGDGGCHALVLTGAGRGFCAGWDIKANPNGLVPDAAPAGMDQQRHAAHLIRRLRNGKVPVVAAVNGPASGGGFAVAMACDLRLAGESARFNAGFVKIGLSGGDLGMSWLLPRAIGTTRAFELLLTGDPIDAAEADRIGLVSRVVPDGELLDRAVELARSIAANSPFAVELTKEVLWANLEVPSLYAAMELENRTQILATTTDDHREALRAFKERRPPKFEGR
ncbi:MAG TPA: enoyl-CoA hydratase [Microthrixaceae bacterium]|nr:enoyl-CoA hydratase [Microthrixaceae bacterium]